MVAAVMFVVDERLVCAVLWASSGSGSGMFVVMSLLLSSSGKLTRPLREVIAVAVISNCIGPGRG